MHPHRGVIRHASRPAQPMIDKLAYCFGIFAPLFTLPQIADIFRHHNVGGISLFSWAGYEVFSVFWLSYSIYHKDKPLIIVHGLWCLMQGAVIAGLLMYR